MFIYAEKAGSAVVIPVVCEVTSSSNKTIKLVSSLYDNKGRAQSGLFVIEGRKFVDELPAVWDTRLFMFSRSYAETNGVTPYANRADCFVVPDALFKSVSGTESPQGILAVARQRSCSPEEACAGESPLIIILDETNDPGNLGAAIRIGDAAGASGLLLSHGCVDMYNPKALRAAAGSAFRLPIASGVDLIDEIPRLKGLGIRIYAAEACGAIYPYGLDLTQPCAFIIGNEARGISDGVSALADARVRLPLLGGAESLNASVACGILIYEAVRQRLVGQC